MIFDSLIQQEFMPVPKRRYGPLVIFDSLILSVSVFAFVK